MRLAITLAGRSLVAAAGLPRLPDLARIAEAVGVDQLGVPDHVVLGAALDGYPHGTFPEQADSPYPEPLTVLAAVAAVTSQIELAPSTLIVPLRPAALLAKTAATLDVLSGGRLVLGAGTGWNRDEFAAVGVPFAGRGARMDDTLRACRALWRDAPASFRSGTVSFEGIHVSPRPLSAESIRIWVAGANADKVAARVADYADGWMPPPSHSAAEVAEGVERIREARRSAGGDLDAFDVKIALPLREGDVERSLAEHAPAFAEAGVTMLQIAVGSLASSPDDVPQVLERIAERFADYR